MENFSTLVNALGGIPFLEVLGAATMVAACRLSLWLKNNQWTLKVSNDKDKTTFAFDVSKRSEKRSLRGPELTAENKTDNTTTLIPRQK